MEKWNVLARLKSLAPYPVREDFIESVMVRRGLEDVFCTQEVMQSAAFKGAEADILRRLATFPSSTTEGDVSISRAASAELLSEASRLYREIGECGTGDRPTITIY